MADTVLWTILMLLTASGLFFNRKAGEFRRIWKCFAARQCSVFWHWPCGVS